MTGGGEADDRWLKSEINRIGDEAESTEDEVCLSVSFFTLLLLSSHPTTR